MSGSTLPYCIIQRNVFIALWLLQVACHPKTALYCRGNEVVAGNISGSLGLAVYLATWDAYIGLEWNLAGHYWLWENSFSGRNISVR